MCGVNGILAYHDLAPQPERAELIATRERMAARGPDGKGEWWSTDGRLGLGHRRLAILDLSNRATQPMRSADGRYVIVFNGEIYNYPALRAELIAAGIMLRTTSDTEILLHLFAQDGEAMVHRLRGMFAFAIWDDVGQRLFLARDPYGIKPLYTADDGVTLRFASQVKALLAGNRLSSAPDPAGLVGFCLWGSVPEPFTIYRDIKALPSGSWQWIDRRGAHEPVRYAAIPAILAEGARCPVPVEAVTHLVRQAVGESVAAHALSDVEVGVFLSAGIDSGAILGLMRDHGQERVRVVTLTFAEFQGTAEDESDLAAGIARHYDAEHVVRLVTREEFDAALPTILEDMDQPSIDGINNWFVAKAAREMGLKVALSGLGGDELLAGYPSFRELPVWVRWLRWPSSVPGLGRALRRVGRVTGLLGAMPKASGMLEYGGDWAGAYLLRRGLFLPFELSDMLGSATIRDGLEQLRPLERLRSDALAPDPCQSLSRVAALESTYYLRNQLLRDSDWAGMAHGLEIRTPLVDAALLNRLAPAIPRLTSGLGKVALATAPSRPLPPTIVNRPKTGFGVPMGEWRAHGGRRVRNKGAASRAWADEVLASALTRPMATSLCQ